MCRLLGVVSAETTPLTQSLATELAPFSELSAVHCDGWGLAAWSPTDDLVIRKRPTPALVEPGLLTEVATITTDAALLHLRKASSGLPVVDANTHPFSAGSIAFAHNGYFPPTAAIDELMRELDAEPPVGDTDSERYFRIVLALMRTHGPVSALARAAAMISERVPVKALNALMLTHQALYAFAFYDADAVPGDPASQTFEMRFRISESEVLVASSGWEQPVPVWEPLVSGTVLEVRRHDLGIALHRPAKPTKN